MSVNHGCADTVIKITRDLLDVECDCANNRGDVNLDLLLPLLYNAPK